MAPAVEVRPLATDAEAAECARLMASSDPWLTLGRGYEECLAVLQDPAKARYVASLDGRVAGFLILDLQGPFTGYIQSIGVRPDLRGQGLGSQLLAWAESRIWRDSPNVFMCVSSFNDGAQRLYARLGYEVVGRLTSYLVSGHDELLLRKTRGPWNEFRRDIGGPAA